MAIRLAFISLAIALFALPQFLIPAIAGPSGMTLQGVNISGAEWGASVIPGTVGVNYIYPTTYELDYFSSKGMNIIRVPFSWERMQPNANTPLDANELARMDAVVSGATARGL